MPGDAQARRGARASGVRGVEARLTWAQRRAQDALSDDDASAPATPTYDKPAQRQLARERWSKLRAVVLLASRVESLTSAPESLEDEEDAREGETTAGGDESTSGADGAAKKYFVGQGTPQPAGKATKKGEGIDTLFPGVNPNLSSKLVKSLKGKSIRARLTTNHTDLDPEKVSPEEARRKLQADIDSVFRLESGNDASKPKEDESAGEDGKRRSKRLSSTAKRGTLYERVQAEVFDFMTNTDHSFAAWLVSTIILALIFLSSVTFCLETIPELQNDSDERIFYMIEIICVATFTVEYAVKFWAAPARWVFFKQTMNLIDFVAILPFYMEMTLGGGGGGSTRIVRIIRLVRVFRVLKLGGRFGKMAVVGTAVMESADMLGMLMFLLILSMVLFSTLAYYSEEVGPAKDDFPSIPATFWWCIVTLMTVGYGDVIPATIAGKLVASVTMIASIIITALPISVIGAHFTSQWVRYQESEKLQSKAKNVIDNQAMFIDILKEHDTIFKQIVDQIQQKKSLSQKRCAALFRMMASVQESDTNKSIAHDNGNQIAIARKSAKRKEVMDTLFLRLEESRESLGDMDELFAMAEHMHSGTFAKYIDRTKISCRKLKNHGEDTVQLFKQVDELQREISELEDVLLVQKLATEVPGAGPKRNHSKDRRITPPLVSAKSAPQPVQQQRASIATPGVAQGRERSRTIV